MSIYENVQKIKEQLTDQIIIAATKYVGVNEMQDLLTSGINHFGENRVQSFVEKKAILTDDRIVWHFIGSLQTNKVKKIINDIEYLHSLDRIHLAEAIQLYRKTPLKCFIEVHIGQEETKQGLSIEEVAHFIQELQKYDKIEVVGLMGMASHTTNQEVIYQDFMKLNQLMTFLKQQNYPNMTNHYLSMGMSDDYLIALQAGATHLRLGRILFRNEE